MKLVVSTSQCAPESKNGKCSNPNCKCVDCNCGTNCTCSSCN